MPPTAFDWEIDLILRLRNALPGLVGVFEALTFMGNEMFFLMLLPLVYWCLDRRTGARLAILYLTSTYVNGVAKLLFDMPRPMDIAPERLAHFYPIGIEAARETYDATGNGFPSGHTQSAVVVWGYLASRLAARRTPSSAGAKTDAGVRAGALLRPALLAGAALLIVLIPLSRVYLGVHFPRDLAGGYVLGALMLALGLWLQPGIEAALARWPLAQQLALAAGLPLVLVLLQPTEYTVTAAATLLGMGAGIVLERRWVRFESAVTGGWRDGWRIGLRFLLGAAVMLGLYGGLKAAFAALAPATEAAVLALRFIRYAVIGLWGSIGAPWVFVRVGLAERREEERVADLALA